MAPKSSSSRSTGPASYRKPSKHTSNKFKKSSSHTEPTKTRPQSNTNVNPLKKRRRDLQRLLKHSGETLAADVRVNYERELAACDAEIEIAHSAAERSRMIKRYHMVRFFERKKATRLLKKARQRLAQARSQQAPTAEDSTANESTVNTSEIAELEAEVHAREIDLNYTLFFPLSEVYVSLYVTSSGRKPRKASLAHSDTAAETTNSATNQKATNDEAEGAEDDAKVNRTHPMWQAVENATALSQRHLQILREGKSKTKQPSVTPMTKAKASLQPQPYHDQGEDDDDDDGGFFET